MVVNMTMKSGTNQYHGSGYNYFVNEDLAAAGDPFSRSGGCIVGPTGPGLQRRRQAMKQISPACPPQRFRRNPGRSVGYPQNL